MRCDELKWFRAPYARDKDGAFVVAEKVTKFRPDRIILAMERRAAGELLLKPKLRRKSVVADVGQL